MSVTVPVIDHLDTATKRIYLAAGVRAYHPVTDIYAEVRNLRRTDEALRRFLAQVTAAGNVSKGGGRFTPRYAVFHGGWRVVPEDVSHTLVITGEQLTEEGGAGADCMDLALLSASSKVTVQYEPPAAEVIVVSAGGGGSYPTATEIADAVWDTHLPDHLSAASAGEALAAASLPSSGGLTSAQAAQLNELYRLFGLDAAVAVEHGETYIKVPADGSEINIKLTKIGTRMLLQRQ